MRTLMLIVLSLVLVGARAQEAADSVVIVEDDCHRFAPQQLLAGGGLLLTGIALTVDHDNGVNRAVDDAFGSEHRWHGDDVLRFVPSAAYLTLGVFGVKARHNFKERTLIFLTSHAAMAAMAYGTKYAIDKTRPDGGDHSFPSGHVALAFTGAELVRLEYGNAWGAGAYVVAGTTAVLRLKNRRHWLGDVMAGAGIGLLSAHIGYWLLPVERRLFGLRDSRATVVAAPSYDPFSRSATFTLNARF